MMMKFKSVLLHRIHGGSSLIVSTQKDTFKKILSALSIIIINIAFSTNIYSQIWCPTGSTWYYTDRSADVDGYSKFTYSNDTVISSIICKKITHYYKYNTLLQNVISGYSVPYFTYSKNGAVYLYNNKYGNNKFDTLFNINAQIGDKWRFPLVDTACADSFFFMKVLNTGIKNLNGFNLKWLYVKKGPFDGTGHSYVFDTITERLGYRYDNISYSTCHNSPSETPTGDLRCYSDDVFGFYSTGISSSCDYYTGISESTMGYGELKIYPNPTNDKLNITSFLLQGKTATLTLYDLTGRLVLQCIPLGVEGNSVSTESLSEGIYIYKLNVNDINVRSGKLSIIR